MLEKERQEENDEEEENVLGGGCLGGSESQYCCELGYLGVAVGERAA